eukprot:2450817-Amphidinium_carterae.1
MLMKAGREITDTRDSGEKGKANPQRPPWRGWLLGSLQEHEEPRNQLDRDSFEEEEERGEEAEDLRKLIRKDHIPMSTLLSRQNNLELFG